MKHNFECQSCIKGTSPSSRSSKSFEFFRICCAERIRDTVSWSPPTSTWLKRCTFRVSSSSVSGCSYVYADVVVGTYVCRTSNTSTISSVLLSLFKFTPRDTLYKVQLLCLKMELLFITPKLQIAHACLTCSTLA